MEAHGVDDAVGVARFDEPDDLAVGIDDTVHQGREERVLAALRANGGVGEAVENVVTFDHEQIEIVHESLVAAGFDDGLVKLPVELEPAG